MQFRHHLICLLFLLLAGTARSASAWQETLGGVALGDKKVVYESWVAKPMILQFWASWCSGCVGVMGELEKLHAQHSEAAYVALNVDSHIELAQKAEKSLAGKSFSALHLFDAEKKWATKFAVLSVPTILLVDSRGNIRFRHTGHLDAETKLFLVEELKLLSDETTANTRRTRAHAAN
jgi:thiol-disulfide isomerase/thioredoxin